MRRGRLIALGLVVGVTLVAWRVWVAWDAALTAPAGSTPAAAPSKSSPREDRRSKVEEVRRRQASMSSELPTASLTGVVRDGAGNAVHGAEVLILDSDIRIAVDEEGRFAATGLRQGRHVLQVRSAIGQSVPVTVFLRDGAAPVQLRLVSTVTLEVAVLTPAGRPVRHGEVLLFMKDRSSQTLRSRSTAVAGGGRARFQVVPGELYVAAAHAPGFGFAARRVNGAASTLGGEIRLRLTPGGSLRGRVRGEHGEPLAKAKVTAFQRAPGIGVDELPLVSGETDSTGEYALSGIGPGTWWVEASMDGLAPASSDPVEVGSSEARTPVNLRLRRGGRIAGSVVSTAMEPAPGAYVEVRWHDEGHAQSVETQADGRGGFAITGLPRRDVWVSAESAWARSSPQLVRLGKASEHLEELIILDRDGAVSGSVVDGRGPLVSGAMLFCEASSDDSQVRRSDAALPVFDRPFTFSGADGRFVLTGLEHDAACRLSAVLPGAVGNAFPDPVASTPTRVAQGADSVVISLPALSDITGRVRVAGPGLPSDARIALLPGGFEAPIATSDGAFSLHDVLPRSLPYKLRVRGASFLETQVDVEVAGGQAIDLGEIAVAPARPLEGRVVDANGQPVFGASVLVRKEGGGDIGTVESDDRGEFCLGVPIDTAVHVQAHDRGSGFSEVVTVRPSASRRHVRLVVPARGAIAGQVETGTVPFGEIRILVRYAGKTAKVLVPDAVGRFESRLRAGHYVLYFRDHAAGERLDVRIPIDVESGKTARTEVDLRRALDIARGLPARPPEELPE